MPVRPVHSSFGPCVGNVRCRRVAVVVVRYLTAVSVVVHSENGQEFHRLDLDETVVGLVSVHHFDCVLHQGVFTEKSRFGRRYVTTHARPSTLCSQVCALYATDCNPFCSVRLVTNQLDVRTVRRFTRTSPLLKHLQRHSIITMRREVYSGLFCV